MTPREILKANLEEETTLYDITQHLIDYMGDEYDYLADLFIYRAYQLGLETGVEAKKEMDAMEGNFANADKNLQELTWQDVKRIVEIADDILERKEYSFGSEEEYYTEVLRRFTE